MIKILYRILPDQSQTRTLETAFDFQTTADIAMTNALMKLISPETQSESEFESPETKTDMLMSPSETKRLQLDIIENVNGIASSDISVGKKEKEIRFSKTTKEEKSLTLDFEENVKAVGSVTVDNLLEKNNLKKEAVGVVSSFVTTAFTTNNKPFQRSILPSDSLTDSNENILDLKKEQKSDGAAISSEESKKLTLKMDETSNEIGMSNADDLTNKEIASLEFNINAIDSSENNFESSASSRSSIDSETSTIPDFERELTAIGYSTD
jgi:hypothetical protein